MDAKGRRQGLWITWYDTARRQPLSISRFRDGREYRTSRYYYENGKTRVRFRYKGDSIVWVRYYDSCGKLSMKGRSLLLYSDKEIRYCWDGMWKYYDCHHHLIQTEMYRKGEETGNRE
ncbi:MAG: hypothetical protein WCR72_05305 [Bacteroidota bacterium]